ncbi:unnamed protein product [Protopolystoma xenopodis]|uniref:Uncharacterized protein n=1 Tax=Protopolystoma xenopodis TaxID=117903 RepID=A0A3S5C9J6_9PLAT|nr:unnamed protein product [Protopolystoma xenopodis]
MSQPFRDLATKSLPSTSSSHIQPTRFCATEFVSELSFRDYNSRGLVRVWQEDDSFKSYNGSSTDEADSPAASNNNLSQSLSNGFCEEVSRWGHLDFLFISSKYQSQAHIELQVVEFSNTLLTILVPELVSSKEEQAISLSSKLLDSVTHSNGGDMTSKEEFEQLLDDWKFVLEKRNSYSQLWLNRLAIFGC